MAIHAHGYKYALLDTGICVYYVALKIEFEQCMLVYLHYFVIVYGQFFLFSCFVKDSLISVASNKQAFLSTLHVALDYHSVNHCITVNSGVLQ